MHGKFQELDFPDVSDSLSLGSDAADRRGGTSSLMSLNVNNVNEGYKGKTRRDANHKSPQRGGGRKSANKRSRTTPSRRAARQAKRDLSPALKGDSAKTVKAKYHSKGIKIPGISVFC
jgi:hypothetical protein